MIPGLKLGDLAADDRRRRLSDRLLWMPFNLLQVFSFLVVCSVLIPLALLMRRMTGSCALPLWMAHRWWGPIVVGGGTARLVVEGREHWAEGRSYLVVCNHQSYFDIPVLYSALPSPLHFLGADRLAGIPGVGHFGMAVGTIYLDKRSAARASRSASELSDYLRAGKTTVLFPEGTRTRDGSMGRFSPMLFTAAIDAEVEILPVAIVGSRTIMPRGGGFLFRPGTVEVRIGAPIPTHGLTAEDRGELASTAWNSVHRLLTLFPCRATAANGNSMALGDAALR